MSSTIPSGEDAIAREDHGPVALVRLQRPERRNAFDAPTIRALREAVDAAFAEDAVRCVVLTGSDGSFCSGGDVKAMAEAAPGEGLASYFKRLTRHHHPLVRALRQTPTPVVTAIDGPATGGGLGLALAGDLRVASERAILQAAYPQLDVVPDGGVTHLLPRIAGLAAAQRMLLLDEAVDAGTAAELGLVHEVHPPSDLEERALGIGRELAQRDPFALERTKRLLERSHRTPLGEQLEQERRWNAEGATREAVRGKVEAFGRDRDG